MMDWTELASLVTKIQSGQTEAWGELYEKITPYIFSRTRYLLKNSADAEDATQETLIEIYKSLNNLSDPQALGGWVKTITLRKCYKYYKKPTHEDVEGEEGLSCVDTEGIPIDFIDDRQPTIVEEIEAQETADNLRQMIEALPQSQRETMILFYYDNLKIREIAEFMGCSENTVKSRLNYAKHTMEAEISEKRKKGILFPAIMPWPLIFRQLYTEAFEEQAGQVGIEVLQRIGENVASELGGMEGLGGSGETGAGGMEGTEDLGGTGGSGGNIGSIVTTIKGLTVATKAIIGIVAALALVAGVILLNQPSEPKTDSDYAHIYYDYIQNEVLPTGYYDDGGVPYQFIDADMIHLDRSEKPLLIMSYNTKHESTDDSIREGFTLHEYNSETGKVEQIQTHEGTGLEEFMNYTSLFIVEVDGYTGIGTLFEMVNNSGYHTGANLSVHELPVNISNQQYHVYNGEGCEEISQILSGQVGTWGVSTGEAATFPIVVENTNGERLRDYFDD